MSSQSQVSLQRQAMHTSHFCAAKGQAQLVRLTCNSCPACADTSQCCFPNCLRADPHPRTVPLPFQEPRHIQGGYLCHTAQASCPVHTPHVTIPLRKKVQEELSRIQYLGVISPVEEPAQWCSGMIGVRKSSGAVRICVDFRQLNESIDVCRPSKYPNGTKGRL